MRHRTLVIAHDGCEDSRPHTLESALRGLRAGADIVEVDVRATRDGMAILHHDETVTLDGGQIRISDVTCADLEELRRSGAVTTLDEVLDAVGGAGGVVNLDIKEDRAVEPAVQSVRTKEMVSRVVFSGCEWSRARYLKSHHRDCQVLLNASDAQYAAAGEDYPGVVRWLCEEATEASCCGLNVYQTFCTEDLVAYAALRFLPVSVWTVDDGELLRHFLDIGVNAITTNRVSLLRSLM